MFETITTAAILYIATAVDLLVILLIFFFFFYNYQQYKDIYIGQYLGSLTLIIVSLFFAYVLNYVPDKWILGLLGLIPIYLGIKVAIFDDCEGERRAKDELNKKGLSELSKSVAVVTLASCGADNIGLFVPYFTTINNYELVITLITFVILIFILVFTAQKLANIPGLGEVIERFSRWIMSIVYIGLGLFIIIENGTVQKLFHFVF